MFPKVLQDVDQRRADLARSPQRASMVAVGPHPTAMVRRTIDCSCAASSEALNSSRKGLALVRLDDEVDIICLYREVKHAKCASVRSCERALQDRKDVFGSEGWETSVGAEGDEDGVGLVVRRSADMPDAGPSAVRLAPGACSQATPAGRNRETELLRPPPCHLDLALFRPASSPVA